MTILNTSVRRRVAVAAALLTASAVLTGCGETASSNPDAFSSDKNGNTITAKYNPAGFESKMVRGLLSAQCAGGNFASYTEVPSGNLIAVTAVCAG